MSLSEPVAAIILSMALDGSLPDSQALTLSFLKKDRGDYVASSLLDSHPMAQEFGIERGTLVVSFLDSVDRFLVYPNGALTVLLT